MTSQLGRRQTLLALATALAACKGGEKQGRGQGSGKRRERGEGGPSFPVEAYEVAAKRVEYTITAPGSIDAFERVQVTARVSGGVDKVGFVEGQSVKKGDVLVVIDSERYQVAVNTAAAALEKAKATQTDAESMVTRREKASEKHPGLIPGEEISTLQTKVLTAKADLNMAVQDLKGAQLNLRDSSVRAPIDGVIQTRTVETGQYVQAGYVMATLLRSDPLLLRFQVAPVEAPRLKPGLMATFRLRETLRVFQAKITLVAAAADPQSRMVPITAEVQKDEHDYWLRPGSFSDVTIPVGGARDVIVVPRMAVRPTENGFVAFVVEGDVVHERVLSLGMNTSDGWVEVRDGLKAGDKLVWKGLEPLAEGAKVKMAETAPPASSAFITPGASAAPAASGAPPAGSAPEPPPPVAPPASGAPPAGSAP
ncbi:MAG: efflux RND transporter periplasmic adaptor subunit [Polyangiaceae bacterium]|nr:efflux RND transporter periplasmic adaptor subunit [Polyangiaceae bacterium]